jgi:hypothetical protein
MSRPSLPTLWSDEAVAPLCLGCADCPDQPICGGLYISGGNTFNCLSACCGRPTDCNYVCRRNSDFVDRVQEVGGFSLATIPRARELAFPVLAPIVTHIYHGSKRNSPFKVPVVSLSLYDVLDMRRGLARFRDRSSLLQHFRLAADTKILLSGTDEDEPLEAWWKLGDRRIGAIHTLKGLGVSCVTSPNYSTFADIPRWDNLHSIRRIAITWEEFISAGIPAALHVNARTDRDWSNWADFISERPEVTAIAFEYATGAGWKERMAWHTAKLVGLTQRVGRTFRVVIRGGLPVIPQLEATYRAVSYIDTTSFMKTIKRQKAFLDAGVLRWSKNRDPKQAFLDELLAHNAALVEHHVSRSTISRTVQDNEQRTETTNPFKRAS